MNFNAIKTAIATQFERFQHHPYGIVGRPPTRVPQLFRADISGDELWSAYLAAFPAGSNPVLRERTEHDCSACRQFVRALGNVVAVIDGQVASLWDVRVPSEPAYQAVCATLSSLVLSRPIAGPFYHHEPTAGVDRNYEELDPLGKQEESGLDCLTIRTWTHFFVNIDRRFVAAKDAIPSLLAERRSSHDVFLRSLREITDDAVETVLDLVAQGSLYRGEENRHAVEEFRALKAQFSALADERAQDVFAWTTDTSGAVSRIRNTAIGTLLVALSEGEELDAAVRSFEQKVAPANYQRPTALISKAMVAEAKETLEALGLTSALERRYATLADISVNDVLFADRSARRSLANAGTAAGALDELMEATPGSIRQQTYDKVEEVSVERFLAEIVPRATTIEVLLENRHRGNLVSLIAPVDPTARRFFKWDNGFSWSYAGEVADAIKERVKAAGGSVIGDLCCRLAWSNRDDLDFHMQEPGGYELYFANRRSASPSGGHLDVDMNVRGETREPVENIFYADRGTMREGTYTLFVHQFRQRETTDVGFECEIDYLGTVHRFAYTKPVRQDERIVVAKFRYTHRGGLEMLESLPATEATRTVWGLPTQTFHRVNALLLSPNYWSGQGSDRGVGNKHYIFALDGCVNDGSARGFFNEMLRADLTPHRKVFEVVASRMKPANSAEQLSGLGFSSTQRNALVCRVKGSFTRTVKVVF